MQAIIPIESAILSWVKLLIEYCDGLELQQEIHLELLRQGENSSLN